MMTRKELYGILGYEDYEEIDKKISKKIKILARKIELPRLFNLKQFQELFVESGEISDKRVDKFISKIKI